MSARVGRKGQYKDLLETVTGSVAGHNRDVKFGIQIGSDRPKMGQIGDFLRSVIKKNCQKFTWTFFGKNDNFWQLFLKKDNV